MANAKYIQISNTHNDIICHVTLFPDFCCSLLAKLDLMMEHKDTHEFLIAFVWPFPKGDMIILILQREISRMGCANPGLIIPDPPMLVVNSHFPCVLYRPIPLIQQTTCMDLGSPVHLGFYSTHSSKGTWTIWAFLLYFPTTLPQTNTL